MMPQPLEPTAEAHPEQLAPMLNISQVAKLLGISGRHAVGSSIDAGFRALLGWAG